MPRRAHHALEVHQGGDLHQARFDAGARARTPSSGAATAVARCVRAPPASATGAEHTALPDTGTAMPDWFVPPYLAPSADGGTFVTHSPGGPGSGRRHHPAGRISGRSLW